MAKSKISAVQKALDEIPSFDDVLDDEIDAKQESLYEANTFLNENLLTHAKARNSLVGNLTLMEKSFAKSTLQTTPEMGVDEFGLVHSGFIFGAGEYVAVAAINMENVVIIGCRSKFFAPAKVGDIIDFEAKGRFEDARKREVKVIGMINEIKVFEGIFHAVLLDSHVLHTKIDELQARLSEKEAPH